ncbi:enoyl-CoA hydratase/isomerase family protein [Leptospira mayottensis]|uniref:Enoyl-CoA hydratase/isomerase family protein n=2 Tax=Leptospira mayottensis TaxID=1137606 RepID=A0AA87MNB6_9LEPT|nr:enoyl-CoA hydratase/isomerase family protein [Leptospira mayottensis]AXR61432.1 enoyl-CoA hydratase/isomerase family protein [Leptospira mayottensis]AXR65311.1 enoyl-CoA hydratase/isomerase family protein [Leptospira mayottensis]AZQ02129.1 enoyl-CoA hydratase/isomerase family protein [Leptospira mayottensis 200901116]EKR99425.1 enoyl-CoA hydratase/isomerase family protein [Leptospira mayottensis 200901122]TGN10137.1 enoyl-CoA hydratase/isomerase family protein [Leptospira mayottensis]
MLSEIRNNHILELYIETNEVNSLNEDFFKTISAKLDAINNDPTVKAVILTSKNEKFFSNGFNPEIFVGKTSEQIQDVMHIALDTASKYLFLERPVICAMNGHAMGLGAVLAIFSDYRIMVEKKGRIGFPESQIGINFPAVPGFMLKEIVGITKARDLLYSGKGLKAEEALEIGLIDEISSSSEDLMVRARKYCNQFKDMAIGSVIGIKVSLRDPIRFFAEHNSERDVKLISEAVSSKNGQEGMTSILERRRPIFL